MMLEAAQLMLRVRLEYKNASEFRTVSGTIK